MDLKRRDARRTGADDGFTLVEMSVAMVVLSIVLAALGAFLITAVAQQQRNELRSQAVQVAQQAVEEARALPWELLGFYSDDAAIGTCTSPAGAVVSIPAPANAAQRSARVPTAGPRTVPVQGTDYTRTVCYRWFDDPADGTGASDTNGTQDAKLIEVDVAWTSRGVTQTHRVEARRAPTASEVAPRSASGHQPFGITSVTPDPTASHGATIDDSGNLSSALTFTATTSTGVSTVQLRWSDATGADRLVTLSTSGSSTSWSTTLPVGTGPFPAAAVTFTLTAYSSTGETSTQTTRVSFSQTPGSLTITSVSATPNSVDVNSAGNTAVAFTVNATTGSAATSASVSYTNRSGARVTQSMTTVSSTSFSRTFPAGSGPFADGATTFTVTVTSSSGTASSSTTVTFVPPAVVPVAVVSATAAPQLCYRNSDGALHRSTTVTVVVEGLGSSDGVKLQLNDAASTRVDATSAGSDGGRRTFTYTVTGSGWNFKNRDNLTVSVLATRASDNTQATRIYNFPVTKTNSSTGCPA